MFKTTLKPKRLQSVFQRYFHLKETNVGIVGVPCDKGQKGEKGQSGGPKALRDGGLLDKLKHLHEKMDVKDYGDITYTIPPEAKHFNVPNMNNYPHIPYFNQEVSKNVERVINDGRICLTLGGDHSLAIGSVDGHIKAKRDVCILYVDTHGDINTNSMSDSGNVHGMPLALLVSELKDYWPHLPGMDWLKPTISIKNLAYIGLRSVDPYERQLLNQFDVAAFGMDQVDKLGIHNVISTALQRIDPDGNKSIHVSFDIDALDPLEAPSTILPVRGGLKLREAVQILEFVHNTGRLGAMDLTEVNPAIGTERDLKMTVDAAIHIILAAFGEKRGGFISKELQLEKCSKQKAN